MDETSIKVFRKIIIVAGVIVFLMTLVMVLDDFLLRPPMSEGWHDIWDLQVHTYGREPRLHADFVCKDGQMMGKIPDKVTISYEIKPGREKIYVYRDQAGAMHFNLMVHPDWPEMGMVPSSQRSD